MTEEKEPVILPECGRRLRSTRQQLGLSVDDIASELRLSALQIRALENDDWSQLPGTTYARGYLKSYARLLGLDADQLLEGASTEEIEISRTEPEIQTHRATATDETPAPSAGKRLPWGWAVTVLLVGALIVFLWRSPEGLQSLPGLFGGQGGPGSGVSDQQGAANGDGGARVGGEEDRTAGVAVPESGARSKPVDAGGMDEPAADASDRPPMPTTPDRVVFQFDERSWIEVRDARGARLLYRNFQSGRRIEVEGQPPFKVFLGNAGGVQVEYMGRTVKPDTTSGRLYARFVLGPSSS